MITTAPTTTPEAIQLTTGESPPTPETPAFVQVATGENHVCALRGNGQVVCWGGNDDGQLNAPEKVPFQQITSGSHFSCGIQADERINCWGRNNHQQAAPPPGRFQAAAAGWDHACGLTGTTVTCWGWNANERATPPPGVNFAAVGAGAEHSCGLSTAGDLVCWGKNDNGRADSRDGPFLALAVGIAHTCVLDTDGKALCQGETSAGQSEPPETSFVEISAGLSLTCGVLATGHVECWGERQSETNKSSYGPRGRFHSVSAGWSNACAVNRDGQVACWPGAKRLPPPEPHDYLMLENISPGSSFSDPTDVIPWPTGGLAIADRKGRIDLLTPELSTRPILDLTASVDSDYIERGLLSISIHPKDPSFLYVYYSRKNTSGSDVAVARLSRFPIVDGQLVRERELIVLDIERDAENMGHYGGAIRFGPDDMLYLGIGDADCFECPQRLDTLHGKIIRIDVRNASVDTPYTVPIDNPMLTTPGARPEIWAYGLRNPWRMAFDPDDGRLWVADVGQISSEEVSIASPGSNLGWPIYEGSQCLNVNEDVMDHYSISTGLPCEDNQNLVAPSITYGRTGQCAIIGGLVYRGSAIPWLSGTYLFGDYCTGQVWALDGDAESDRRMIEIADLDTLLFSFGTDADGEVLLLTLGGPILRLVESTSSYAPGLTHAPAWTVRTAASSPGSSPDTVAP